MSAVALSLGVASVATFGYAVYFLNFDQNVAQMHGILPEPLRPYGHLKFLTYQCLLIQTLNAILHVLAYFSKSLEGARDFVFSTLAYPVGSIVCYSFWAVWFLLGRELIFPAQLSQYYPDWLNHVTHTIIAPLNIVLCLLVNHRYQRLGFAATLSFIGGYLVFLHYLKFKTGFFVYKYLDVMGDAERIVYFGATAVFAFVLYKSGEYLTKIAHGAAGRLVSPARKPQSGAAKKPKQK